MTWPTSGKRSGCRRLGDAAADAGELTSHIARHAWADLARNSGRDVYGTRQRLAHSGLGTTERYLAKGGGDAGDGEL